MFTTRAIKVVSTLGSAVQNNFLVGAGKFSWLVKHFTAAETQTCKMPQLFNFKGTHHTIFHIFIENYLFRTSSFFESKNNSQKQQQKHPKFVFIHVGSNS